jgi:hypothetical protein
VGAGAPFQKGGGGGGLRQCGAARAQLYETIRREGYYISIGERDEETAGISTPVFSAEQPLAGALTLAGPRSRVDDALLKSMRRTMVETSIRATELLGGDAAPLRAALAVLDDGRGSNKQPR